MRPLAQLSKRTGEARPTLSLGATTTRPELAEQEEARVEPLLDDLLGGRSGEVMELLERFDASRPTDEPHY